MSPGTKRALGDWVIVGTLLLTIVGHALVTERRLSKVEQKLDDLIEFVKRNHAK